MKKTLIILLLISLLAVSGCSQDNAEEKPTIAVGIPPLAGFMDKIAGDNFDIVVLIPAGNSPANYQPAAMEMQQLSEAEIYFTLQMPTEEANILPKAPDFNKDLNIINLREEVSKVYPLVEVTGHSHDEDHEDEEPGHEDEMSVDPHLWLSPLRSIEMVRIMAEALSELDPENSDLYESNASEYIDELKALDSHIRETVENLENRTFMIYHGSYTYFADDYGFEMIALEVAGKQATASEIQEVIEHAMEENINVVFYQDEFDDNQARTVAAEINGRVEKVSPLSRDYVTALSEFLDILAGKDD
ncbi:MAG TPA: zinc ABC transporter substrate-binding protein [Clostridia bacterium]|nr:zinc ABC transporter substrate-binding protein [Clostridia bacterium]HRX41862.1 zinc ABC transporter substrate-binding protein [Clostridia bacterium]